MVLSKSWEATICIAVEGLPRILWNLKAICHVHKSPPRVQLVTLLTGELSQITTLIIYSLKLLRIFYSSLIIIFDSASLLWYQFFCYREHFHCLDCNSRVFVKKEEMIRHFKWHKKRDESLQHGFMRYSPMDDCSDRYRGCSHNRKQTHYHCIKVLTWLLSVVIFLHCYV